MKPSASRVSRKPRRLAAASSHFAFCAGCRQVVAAWSSRVGRPVRERRPPELDGRGVGRFAERGHRRLGHLDATGRLLVRGGGAGHGDRRLLRRDRRTGGQDDLRQAAAVADDQEGDLRQLAPAVDPAVEPDLLARGRRGELGCECASHANPPVATRPWRCGRGQGRGATTPSPGQPRPQSRAFRSGPRSRRTHGLPLLSRIGGGSSRPAVADRNPTDEPPYRQLDNRTAPADRCRARGPRWLRSERGDPGG